MNSILFIPVLVNFAQGIPLIENNDNGKLGLVDSMNIISYNIEEGEALMSGYTGQNQSSFDIDDEYMHADELLWTGRDMQKNDRSPPEGVSLMEGILGNKRVKRASKRNQENKRQRRRNKNLKRNKGGIGRKTILDRKATYNSAYFAIDATVQDGHKTFECKTQPRNTVKEIRCWKSMSVPGTNSIHHAFLEFDTVNGRVRVTKNGIYNVFTQLTFVDSGEILADNFTSGLYKNYTQFSLNIGQVTRRCTDPEITKTELGERYRTCFIGWTGPILKDELVYVGNTMGQWEIKADEKYSFWGIAKLDSWIKDA